MSNFSGSTMRKDKEFAISASSSRKSTLTENVARILEKNRNSRREAIVPGNYNWWFLLTMNIRVLNKLVREKAGDHYILIWASAMEAGDVDGLMKILNITNLGAPLNESIRELEGWNIISSLLSKPQVVASHEDVTRN